MMASDEQLDRLSSELNRQSLGPLNTILNEIAFRLASAATTLADSLRQQAYDRPLTTILLSWQVGYMIARVGRHHARR
jgi:hypothetical protein